MTRIALLQMTSGIDVDANVRKVEEALVAAWGADAEMLFTPEMSLLLDRDRRRAASSIRPESEMPIGRLCDLVRDTGVWLALGSLPVQRQDGRWANRSLVISPSEGIVARYDKMHMFDVDLTSGENWRESSAYSPGDEVVVVEGTPVGRLGLAICYDVRFPALFEELGRRLCDTIAIPAAFTVPTGEAHWHLLVRARAIEATAFVIAAAQVGVHDDGRRTFGHSLVVDPWGDVLLDMADAEAGPFSGVDFVEINLSRIAEVRRQLPSLANRRPVLTSDRG